MLWCPTRACMSKMLREAHGPLYQSSQAQSVKLWRSARFLLIYEGERFLLIYDLLGFSWSMKKHWRVMCCGGAKKGLMKSSPSWCLPWVLQNVPCLCLSVCLSLFVCVCLPHPFPQTRSHCSPGLELTENLPASTSHVLGLKA